MSRLAGGTCVMMRGYTDRPGSVSFDPKRSLVPSHGFGRCCHLGDLAGGLGVRGVRVERRHSPPTPRPHGRRQVFGFWQLGPGWLPQVHPLAPPIAASAGARKAAQRGAMTETGLSASRVVIVPGSPTPVSIAFTAGGLGDRRLEIISPVSGPTAGRVAAAERTMGARRRWRSPFAAAA